MGKHSGQEKQTLNSQQFGKHSSKFMPTVETERGGETKPVTDHSVRLAPNLDVKKSTK